MEWTIVGMNFLYAVFGLILMFFAFKVFDWVTPEVSFGEELKKGNIAVAIVIAATFLSIAVIIGKSLQ